MRRGWDGGVPWRGNAGGWETRGGGAASPAAAAAPAPPPRPPPHRLSDRSRRRSRSRSRSPKRHAGPSAGWRVAATSSSSAAAATPAPAATGRSLRQLCEEQGIDPEVSKRAGPRIAEEYRRRHGDRRPAKQWNPKEQCKVAVYDRDEAGWVVEYLWKAQRGQLSPPRPPPAPQQPESRGGAAAHGHRPEAPPQPPAGSVTHYQCTQCGDRKLKMEFSKNMQKGNKSVIRCKLCVSGAQAGPIAQQRVLEAAGQATMECTKCFEWKPVSCFSNNNQSGSTREPPRYRWRHLGCILLEMRYRCSQASARTARPRQRQPASLPASTAGMTTPTRRTLRRSS